MTFRRYYCDDTTVMLSAKRLPFMLCLRDELQNYYGRKRIRNFSAVNFAKGNDYFFVNNTAVSKANSVRFTKKRYFHFRTTVNGELFSTNFHA